MQQNNYFTNMINRYGGDKNFVPKLKPEMIQKAAKDRIFREMTLGRIDYAVYGEYFLDSKFLENLIIAAYNELLNKNAIFMALQFFDMHHPGDQIVLHNLMENKGLSQIYTTIYHKLQLLKSTNDIGVMIDIPYLLSDVRQFIM